MTTSGHLLLENLLFLTVASLFLGLTGWRWRRAKPFSVPHPLPGWFNAWLSLVLVAGLGLPLLALGLTWQLSVLQALVPYLGMLVLQIGSEIVALRQFQSCVWVMIPCVYLPYRIWQLYQGLTLLGAADGPLWVQRLLLAEIGLWIFNYGVHLSQLPRLFAWQLQENVQVSLPVQK